RFPGMNDRNSTSCITHLGDKGMQRFVVAIVKSGDSFTNVHARFACAALAPPTVLRSDHPDPHFDGDRQADTGAHRSHAVRNAVRIEHQAGAERSASYSIAGASAVEVDFIVASVLPCSRCSGKLLWVAAA